MDLLKAKLPILAVIAALGIASGAGGTAALAGSRITNLEKHTVELEQRLAAQEERSRQDHDKLTTILVEVEFMSAAVQRIEKKLDREHK